MPCETCDGLGIYVVSDIDLVHTPRALVLRCGCRHGDATGNVAAAAKDALATLAGVRDVLWPPGEPETDWNGDTFETLNQVLRRWRPTEQES